MGKKKFVNGLESLFGSSVEEKFEGEGFMGQHVKPNKKKKKDRKKLERKRPVGQKLNKPRSLSSKNFTSDLDSLFENALTETVDEKINELKTEEKQEHKVARRRKVFKKPMSGLDALIRRTVESAQMEKVEPPAPTKKRVTFVFDKKKLNRLKRISKLEKAYLKDIIGDLITDYIGEYEKNESK